MKNKNWELPAYPEIRDTRNIPLFESKGGLTKLELISAMCLQGMLSNKEFAESHPVSLASYSIIFAKELLKQLNPAQDETNE